MSVSTPEYCRRSKFLEMEVGAQTNLTPKRRDNENYLFGPVENPLPAPRPPTMCLLVNNSDPRPQPIHNVNVYWRGSINSRNAPN